MCTIKENEVKSEIVKKIIDNPDCFFGLKIETERYAEHIRLDLETKWVNDQQVGYIKYSEDGETKLRGEGVAECYVKMDSNGYRRVFVDLSYSGILISNDDYNYSNLEVYGRERVRY